MKFIDLAKCRHSVRGYINKAIEPEKLEYVMQCVRLAPSAVNIQPWKFITVKDDDAKRKIRQCYKRNWFGEAPMYFIACADHTQSWHRPSDGRDHADIDVAIAVEHLCLAATEQGLGTCWVCNFDAQLCSRLFNLEPGMEPCVLIPIGYASEAEKTQPRGRKELPEIWI